MKMMVFEIGLNELLGFSMRNGNEVILNELTSKWGNEWTGKCVS